MSVAIELEEALKIGAPKEGPAPFFLQPDKPRGAGVLLVHGFSATPREMRLFGEAFCREGYHVLGIRLPGHGTTPEDLAGKSYEDWLEATVDGYQYLKSRTERQYGLGLSTGTLLLLALAQQVELAGLVLLSPYLRLKNRLASSAWLLRHVKSYHVRALPPEAAIYYYQRRPLQGIFQINRLLRRVRPLLGQVTTPVLAVNGGGDMTVRVESGQELFERLGSGHKEYHLYGPEVPHVLCTAENPRWRSVLELSRLFLDELEHAPGTGPEGGDKDI